MSQSTVINLSSMCESMEELRKCVPQGDRIVYCLSRESLFQDSPLGNCSLEDFRGLRECVWREPGLREIDFSLATQSPVCVVYRPVVVDTKVLVSPVAFDRLGVREDRPQQAVFFIGERDSDEFIVVPVVRRSLPSFTREPVFEVPGGFDAPACPALLALLHALDMIHGGGK